MGVMNVEDGSLDAEELAEDGLSPGKILVYRQGAKPPEMLDMAGIPADFKEEEQNLLNEFTVISGVSDVASSSANATVSSGTALEILIEQDNERMTVVAERIRTAYRKVAVQLMRLYKQFVAGVKAVRDGTETGKISVEYVAGAEISDDVAIENENELLYGETKKKQMLLEMYESGILTDADGNLRAETKEKVLSLLGYGELAGDRGRVRCIRRRPSRKTPRLRGKNFPVDGYDDHKIHAEEHIRYVLGEDGSLDARASTIIRKHIAEHKRLPARRGRKQVKMFKMTEEEAAKGAEGGNAGTADRREREKARDRGVPAGTARRAGGVRARGRDTENPAKQAEDHRGSGGIRKGNNG